MNKSILARIAAALAVIVGLALATAPSASAQTSAAPASVHNVQSAGQMSPLTDWWWD